MNPQSYTQETIKPAAKKLCAELRDKFSQYQARKILELTQQIILGKKIEDGNCELCGAPLSHGLKKSFILANELTDEFPESAHMVVQAALRALHREEKETVSKRQCDLAEGLKK